MKKRQQILLIHGGDTYESHAKYLEELKNKTPNLEWIASQRGWKNEIQDELGSNFVVYYPQMPNKQNAQYEEWKIVFEKILNQLDNNLILIGHSLGGTFLAKYLSENKIKIKIKKTFLLGAPCNNDEIENEPLFSFLRTENLKTFEEQAGDIFVYHSEDDFVVPFSHLAKFQHELPNANIRAFKDRNHFIQTTIPELIEDIKR